MASCGKRWDLAALEVVDGDGAFFASSECCDDTTKGSGLVKEWQKVDDKSITGIGCQGCGEMEAF